MPFEKYQPHHIGIKAGKDIERAFCGQSEHSYTKKIQYKTYEEAKKEAIRMQPQVLPLPATKLINRLNELYPDLSGKMRYYTSLGTAFDVYHGVDAFITLGDAYIVTLDITNNSSKESAKADIVVYTGYKEDGSIDFSDMQINILAQRIGKTFVEKYAKTSQRKSQHM